MRLWRAGRAAGGFGGGCGRTLRLRFGVLGGELSREWSSGGVEVDCCGVQLMAAVEGQVPMLVTSPGIIELIGPRSLRVRIGISTAAPPCPSAEPVSIPVYVLRPSDTLDSPEPLYESLRAGPAASLSAASLLRAVSAKRCLGRATRGLPKLHVFPASRTSTTITATDIQVGIMLEPKSTNEQAAHAPVRCRLPSAPQCLITYPHRRTTTTTTTMALPPPKHRYP